MLSRQALAPAMLSPGPRGRGPCRRSGSATTTSLCCRRSRTARRRRTAVAMRRAALRLRLWRRTAARSASTSSPRARWCACCRCASTPSTRSASTCGCCRTPRAPCAGGARARRKSAWAWRRCRRRFRSYAGSGRCRPREARCRDREPCTPSHPGRRLQSGPPCILNLWSPWTMVVPQCHRRRLGQERRTAECAGQEHLLWRRWSPTTSECRAGKNALGFTLSRLEFSLLLYAPQICHASDADEFMYSCRLQTTEIWLTDMTRSRSYHRTHPLLFQCGSSPTSLHIIYRLH